MNKFEFTIGRNKVRFTIDEGNIIAIESNCKRYNMNRLEETLRLAAKSNLREFRRMYGTLFLSSRHFKIARKILEEIKS